MLFTPLISLKTPICFKTATSLKSHPIHPRTFISLILSYAQILLPAPIPLTASNSSPNLNPSPGLNFQQAQIPPTLHTSFPLTTSNLTFTLTPLVAILIPLTSFHPSYASNPHEPPQATQYIHEPPHIPNSSHSLNSSHIPNHSSQPQPFSRPQFPTSSNPAYSSHEFPPHKLKSHLHAYSPCSHSHPSHKISPLSYASNPHETPQTTHGISKHLCAQKAIHEVEEL